MSRKLVLGVDVGKERCAVSIFEGECSVSCLAPSNPEKFLERITQHLPQGNTEVFSSWRLPGFTT